MSRRNRQTRYALQQAEQALHLADRYQQAVEAHLADPLLDGWTRAHLEECLPDDSTQQRTHALQAVRAVLQQRPSRTRRITDLWR